MLRLIGELSAQCLPRDSPKHSFVTVLAKCSYTTSSHATGYGVGVISAWTLA